MPPDRLDQAVDVLQELPRQAALADARRADDAHQPRPPLAAGGVEQVLEQAQLLVAADERRLERLAPVRARRARRRRAARATPAPAPALPLSVCSPAGSNAIARRRRALRRLADEHGPGRRRRDWSRLAVLTRSPATMPWFVAPIVTAASPVRTPARAWIPGPRLVTASTSSSAARTARSASSSLRDRRAPDGHDRVADELLDRAAVALDHVARELEVAASGVSRTSSASRSSANGVKPTRSANRMLTRRRSATAAPLPSRHVRRRRRRVGRGASRRAPPAERRPAAASRTRSRTSPPAG